MTPEERHARAVDVARAYRRERDGVKRSPVACLVCSHVATGRVGWAAHMRAAHPDVLAAVRLHAGGRA